MIVRNVEIPENCPICGEKLIVSPENKRLLASCPSNWVMGHFSLWSEKVDGQVPKEGNFFVADIDEFFGLGHTIEINLEKLERIIKLMAFK